MPVMASTASVSDRALVEAQGAPRPERGGVADDRAKQAVFVLGAGKRCG
jgi:hypothetical protein